MPIPVDILQRMVDAVELVRQRLVRTSAALRDAKVPYAIVGGNAVAAWVATVDRAAVRSSQNVGVMIRRSDFNAAKSALEAAGFVYRHAANMDLFLDVGGAASGDAGGGRKSVGDNAERKPSARDAVHIVFANEMVRKGEAAANPGVEDSVDMGTMRVLSLRALVQIKLTAFRRKDQVHLMDMIEVGLIDESWVGKMPGVLGERLKGLLETPEG